MAKKRNEKETRDQLIDPKLRLAGWEIINKKHIIDKNKACIETPVSGMPKCSENPSGNGFVDYTLFGDDGKPLALIEAKKAVANEEQGRVQACLYADALERQYGVRPIIYYTNGYSIKIIDGIYPDREVFGFHKKDELEYLIQKRNFKITDKTPNAAICGRYYQMDAIAEVLKHLETKHSRSLIVLATGTGKTRTSCGLSDVFIRNNYVKRILFLADRKNLVVQAKEETFDKYLSTIPMATIIEGRHEGAEDARIVFSTYQSMLSLVKDTTKCQFGIGHFDLIIVDEAHRSLFNKYAEIFDYFDALMIGLTATPRNDIHKSTYRVFNLDKDTPNYEYDLRKAVKDGFLTHYRALDRTPDILKNGLTYDDLSPEDQDQYEEIFMLEDGTIPERVDGEKFKSIITNIDTIDEVLKTLMAEGLKVNNGDILGKTIIFAKDHDHAVKIQERFRALYPELCIPNADEGVDYCVVIDNRIKFNEILQREFKNKQDIRIVVSVDMMDTGVDIPEVVNLVFFKRVMSKIKFWQMVGRGTRLCKNLKIVSPQKAYFERATNDSSKQLYQDKQGFLIFDVCDVFSFFKLNKDGKEDSSDQILSLNQQIFMEQVVLFKEMQSKYYTLDADDRKMYVDLLGQLVDIVNNLNRNYIGVQKNLKYVDKYSDRASWASMDNKKIIEIKKHIAPQITGEIDAASERVFDRLAYKFSSTKLCQSNQFALTAKTIYQLSNFLSIYKIVIPEVAAHKKALDYVQTDDFLTSTTVCQMEKLRLEIRGLMKYIERELIEPIISDFDDKISSTGDAAEDDIDFSVSIDDFKTFEEKASFYIKTHISNSLINKIINMKKYDKTDMDLFVEEMKKIAKNGIEYGELFNCEHSIVVFIRRTLGITKAAIDEFINQQRAAGKSQDQLNYIEELLIFIAQNGDFKRTDLLKEELQCQGLFDSSEIRQLLSDIESAL